MTSKNIGMFDSQNADHDNLLTLLQTHIDNSYFTHAASVECSLMAGHAARPEFIIVDISNIMSELEDSLKRLRRRFDQSSIFVVSKESHVDIARRSIESGVDAVIYQHLSRHVVVVTSNEVRSRAAFLRLIHEGIPLDLRNRLVYRLTLRQIEVLGLLADGLSNKEIGCILKVSPYTVRAHISAILRILGVKSRTGAAAKAILCGFRNQQTLPPECRGRT